MAQKIGLNMYTLRELCKTVAALNDTFAKVREAGYRYVQISGIGEVDPEDIAEGLRKNDLKACATHLGWDRFVEDLPEVVALHQLYGTDHSAIGGLPREYLSLDGIDRFTREAQVVIPELEKVGLDFSYHNHSHEFLRFDGRTWLDRVRDSTRDIGVKFEIDVYWVVAGGADPAEYVESFANEMSIIHMKDMIVAPNREQKMAPVGSGNLNWKRINQSVKSAPIEFVIVEQDSHYEDDPIDNVAASFSFLEKCGYSAE